MKRLKILAIMLMIVMLLIGISLPVTATETEVVPESMEYNISPKTGTLKEGEEITITISISNINMGEEGINTFGGKLIYDENIFEKVEEENFNMSNKWIIYFNNEETAKKGTFLATTGGAKQDQTIGTVTLKARKNLKSTTTEVKFTEVSSVGENEYDLKDSVVKLSIEGSIKDEPTNTGDEKPTPQPEEPASPPAQQTQQPTHVDITASQKDTTISTNKIPNAGEQNTIIIVSALIIISIAIVSYVQIKGNKDV